MEATQQRIEFTVPAVPVAQPRQRHRVVKGKDGRTFASNYTPSKHPVNDFKASCRMAAMEFCDAGPLDMPLSVAMTFVMPRPKAMVWKKKPMPRVPHKSTPDCDNLSKSVMDALSGLLWRDDAQVSVLLVSKVIAAGDESPHVEIVVEEIG